MRKAIHKVYDKAGIKSQRTRNIAKHVGFSFLYKGGSIIANFLLVPLTIKFLDTENYGIWLTLSSFIAWFSFFDIGLGNGLRNKFAEAKAKGDMRLAQAYVSSAYFTIGAVSLGLMIVFLGLNFIIDWTKVFNADVSLQRDLGLLMPIVFSFFCLQLVTKLVTTIYTADQNHSMQGKINFFTQAGSLLAIWLMTLSTKSSLLLFGIVFSALPVFILLALNIFAFNGIYKNYKPKMTLWRSEYLRSIFGLGFVFFIVQISGIVLYSTDNIIISNLFTPADVVPYNIAHKYFSISIIGFNIIAAPYWSSITEAYHKNEFDWILKAMKNLKKIVYVFATAILGMVLLSDIFYEFWINSKVLVSHAVTLLIALFFILSLYVTPYTIFLNGTGKIRLQALQGVIMAIVNIPLSLLLAKVFDLGVPGVILSTVICFIPSVILSQLQYQKIITGKAKSIWNS